LERGPLRREGKKQTRIGTHTGDGGYTNRNNLGSLGLNEKVTGLHLDLADFRAIRIR
jgi:hypothetical protein